MNWQKDEEMRQAKQQQGDHSQDSQKPMPGHLSQRPGQGRQQGDQSGTQEAFRPTDTD